MSDNETLVAALHRYAIDAEDGEVVSDLHEAAARITELEAERDRLKAALKPFAYAWECYTDWRDNEFVDHSNLIRISDLRDARAALSDPSGE